VRLGIQATAMIDSMSSADVANDERFQRIGIAADAPTAARTRAEFTHWLNEFFELDPVRSSDVVLAIYEALANAAEFAYLRAEHPGTMDLQARYDPREARLSVVVCDHGLWRIPGPGAQTRTRGRGIPLMSALSDRTTIDTSPAGTRVCLEWAGVRQPWRSRRPMR
jgi:serine/threonine-protein kinase RsbW